MIVYWFTVVAEWIDFGFYLDFGVDEAYVDIMSVNGEYSYLFS